MRPLPRARAGMGIVGATMASLVTALPAFAVGPQALDSLIISPWPGSVPLPTQTLDAAVNSLHGVQQVASRGQATASIATEGWHAPTSSALFLLITLVEVRGRTRTAAQLTSLSSQLASAAAGTFCETSSSTIPFVSKPAPGVPHGTYVICATSTTGTNAEAIITARANLTEIVATTVQTESPSALESIASQQYEALPAHAPSLAKPSDPQQATHTAWPLRRKLGVVAGVASALIALTLLWIVLRDRRRRRQQWT